MRRSRFVGFVLAVACASPAGASAPLPVIGGDPVRGRNAFVARGCLACHAVRGTGGDVGPDLAKSLVGRGMLAISAAMLNHFPQMLAARGRRQHEPLPQLSPTDLDDVIAYLFAINFVDEVGSPSRGRTIFNQADCARCHDKEAASAAGAPRLGRGSIDASPILIAQSMWNHGARMWRGAQLERPLRRFQPGEFTDLLAYLGARARRFGAGGSALPGDPRVGREVFEARGCAHCHMQAGARTRVEHDLATSGWYRAPSEIAAAMWTHGPLMWARMDEEGVPAAELAGDDMANVISFLYVLRSAGGPGDPEHGALVFQRKHCVRCHGAGGTAPPLVGRTDLETAIHFAAVMWNHAPQMHEALSKEGLEWPMFSDVDVRDVVAYLHRRVPGAPPAADP